MVAQQLSILKPALNGDINEAGSAYPAGANGTRVLDVAWKFATDSQRDLAWRVNTIMRDPKARMNGRLRVGELIFANDSVANSAGLRDGGALSAAWANYRKDPSLANWDHVKEAIEAAKGKAQDSQYASALLATVGKDNYLKILREWMKLHNSPARGLDGSALSAAKRDLGPLAEAFATLDSSTETPTWGRHDFRDWHKYIVEHATMSELSSLLALAHQSRDFVVDSGGQLLQAAGINDGPDWNTYRLVQALDYDPQAMQQLLSRDGNAPLLLRPSVAVGIGIPGFKQLLANALHQALRKGAGDPGNRGLAFANVIKVFGDKAAWPSLRNSPINIVLARDIEQYLPDLAERQAHDQYMQDALSLFSPNGPVASVTPDQATNFFGGLMQDHDILPILQQEYIRYVQALDVGSADPFGTSEQRDEFFVQSRRAGGLSSLFLGGLSSANLSADATADFGSQLAILPVDLAVSAAGPEGLALESLTGKVADLAIKGPLQAIAKDIVSGRISPDRASEEADKLVEVQMAALKTSMKQHGMSPLSGSDESRIKDEFRGMMEPIIVHALKARGG